jgi:TM2 domain-containing membrane protein YozV
MAMIYCRECGKKYSDRAVACPKCGYRTFDADKNIWIYLLLTWFLGIFGVHKFYAGKKNQGVAMLIMGTAGWLLIVPGIAVCIWALIDLIIGICNVNTPEKILDLK